MNTTAIVTIIVAVPSFGMLVLAIRKGGSATRVAEAARGEASEAKVASQASADVTHSVEALRDSVESYRQQLQQAHEREIQRDNREFQREDRHQKRDEQRAAEIFEIRRHLELCEKERGELSREVIRMAVRLPPSVD